VSEALRRPPIVQPDGPTAVPVPPSTPTPQAQTQAAQRRSRRLATDEQVWTLYRRGWSNRAIAQPRGSGRMRWCAISRPRRSPNAKGGATPARVSSPRIRSTSSSRGMRGVGRLYNGFGISDAVGTPGAAPRGRATHSVSARPKEYSHGSGARARRSRAASSHSHGH
jgi:hypothetical protein